MQVLVQDVGASGLIASMAEMHHESSELLCLLKLISFLKRHDLLRRAVGRANVVIDVQKPCDNGRAM